MKPDREQHREVYRAARERLSCLNDRLTEPERDAILREAMRTATRREQRWFFMSLIGGGLLFVVFDALAGLSRFGSIALALSFFAPAVLNAFAARNNRLHHIGKEVMRVLARKGIRPPVCVGCGHAIDRFESDVCTECGCGLVRFEKPSA